MRLSKEEYKKLWQKSSPPSPWYKTVPAAFFTGGLLCLLGQALKEGFISAGYGEKLAGRAVSCALVLLGVFLTAVGIYDDIARFSGAGTLVPITGFANSVAAPAIEFKTEGHVLGTCVKMFTIAGPVITFGVTASVIYGVILFLTGGAL